MAKWFGKVGYCGTVQTEPGYYVDNEWAIDYYGDVQRLGNHWAEQSHSTQDDLTLNVQISIVADPFAMSHIGLIKWVEYMGSKWKVKTLEASYPRIILTLGGVWNG